MKVEDPVFRAFIDSRCFGAGWPPLPEARPRWVTRKRERRPAAKLLARRSPRPRAVHHRHLYFHLNAWRSSLKPNTPIHVVGFDMFDFLHNKRSQACRCRLLSHTQGLCWQAIDARACGAKAKSQRDGDWEGLGSRMGTDIGSSLRSNLGTIYNRIIHLKPLLLDICFFASVCIRRLNVCNSIRAGCIKC